MLLDARQSGLVIVDVQQRLLPAIAEPERVVRGCEVLMRAAGRLGVPQIVTEQYPKGLGATVPELAELAPAGSVMEKIHFSAAAEPAVQERLRTLDRTQLVVAGIEAHVCVLQTALGLKEAGYSVAVVGDACSSRAPANHRAALERLAANGVEVVSVEMVVFEWLHRADTPDFKDLSKLIR